MDEAATPPAIRLPLLTILVQPQAVMRDVLTRYGTGTLLVLAALTGMVNCIGFFAGGMNEFLIHWFAAFAICVTAGALFGMAGLYVDGALAGLACRVLGGCAPFRDVRAAVAWSSAPYVLIAPLMMGGLLLLKQDFFLNLFVQMAIVISLVWAIVLRVRTIGAVQNFGALRSIMVYVVELVLAVAVLLLVALPFRIFLYQPFYIPSASMEPTLLVGDQIFVDKRAYGYSRASFPVTVPSIGRVMATEPKRGDIVVFRVLSPNKIAGEISVDYVKRIAGLPGDEVQMKGGVVHINGQAAPLERVGPFETWDGVRATLYRETLPGGTPHLIIDIAPNSQGDDTPVFKVPAGHYFLLGDSRDNSMDSRFARIGYVAAENLVGRVAVVHFSARKVMSGDPWREAFDNLRWDRMFRRPQ